MVVSMLGNTRGMIRESRSTVFGVDSQSSAVSVERSRHGNTDVASKRRTGAKRSVIRVRSTYADVPYKEVLFFMLSYIQAHVHS